MAGKKKTSKKPNLPVVLETLPMPVQPPKRELVLEGDPDAQLAYASKAAKALMTVVSQKPKPVIIGGKQYLEYGDWQVLARFYGATVEIEWTQKLMDEDGKLIGYEARALVKRNGEIISSAEGMCTKQENRWRTADEYAVRSMAQTRTAAKALRNAFGWVAELAGYSATPAEEMPYDKAPSNGSTKPQNMVMSEAGKRQKIVHLLNMLGYPWHTKEYAAESVSKAIGVMLTAENFDKIIEGLEALVAKDPMATINFSEDPDRG